MTPAGRRGGVGRNDLRSIGRAMPRSPFRPGCPSSVTFPSVVPTDGSSGGRPRAVHDRQEPPPVPWVVPVPWGNGRRRVPWRVDGFGRWLSTRSSAAAKAYRSDVAASSTGPSRAGGAGPGDVDRLLLRRYLAYLGTRRYARATSPGRPPRCGRTSVVPPTGPRRRGPGPAALPRRPGAAGLPQVLARRTLDAPARCRRARPTAGDPSAARGRPAATTPSSSSSTPPACGSPSSAASTAAGVDLAGADGDRRGQGGQGAPAVPMHERCAAALRPLARGGARPPRPATDTRRRPSS